VTSPSPDRDERREGDEPDPVFSAPDDPDDDAEESSLEQPPPH
jgi:hypothetical protein